MMRQWSQAVEAKEGVPKLGDSTTQASITYQCFFKYYAKLSGMTVGLSILAFSQQCLLSSAASMLAWTLGF